MARDDSENLDLSTKQTMLESRLIPATSNRIDLLDIWRGVAVLGIFFANVHTMHSSVIGVDAFEGQFVGWCNDFARRFDQLVVYGKFYSIFSFLFGLGIAMQAGRSSKRSWELFHLRRMLTLFIIGLVHISFLWSGDILHLYAIFGIAALALTRFPSRALVLLAVILFMFPYYESVFSSVAGLLRYDPTHSLAIGDESRIREVFANGSIADAIGLRWQQYVSNLPMLMLHLAPNAFAMFLLGIAFARVATLSNLSNFAKRSAAPVLIFTVVFTTYRIWFLFFLWDTELWTNRAFRPALIRTMEIADSATGLFYLWVLAVISSIPLLASMVQPLKFLGRMALTNYILQSVIGVLLFTGLGLGLYESFSPAKLFGLTWIVIAAQLLWSRAWFTWFRFGPVEWVWRCLSYGSVLPIK